MGEMLHWIICRLWPIDPVEHHSAKPALICSKCKRIVYQDPDMGMH